MSDVIERIETWVRDRHLHTSQPSTQYVKFQEEAGELAADLCRNRDPRDSIGDIGVTLISLAMSLGVDFRECLELAYDVIKDRKGKLVNGVFVKEGDYAS